MADALLVVALIGALAWWRWLRRRRKPVLMVVRDDGKFTFGHCPRCGLGVGLPAEAAAHIRRGGGLRATCTRCGCNVQIARESNRHIRRAIEARR